MFPPIWLLSVFGEDLLIWVFGLWVNHEFRGFTSKLFLFDLEVHPSVLRYPLSVCLLRSSLSETSSHLYKRHCLSDSFSSKCKTAISPFFGAAAPEETGGDEVL